MKNNRLIFGAITLFLSWYTLTGYLSQEQSSSRIKTVSEPIMKKFSNAVDSIKKICTNNPNHRLCLRLEKSLSLQADIDVSTIVNIANTLEQDKNVNTLSQKIVAQIDKNLVYKCFVIGDKKSCMQFERHLKYKALRCGGVRCLWGEGKKTCQAAAFTAAVKCLDCHK